MLARRKFIKIIGAISALLSFPIYKVFVEEKIINPVKSIPTETNSEVYVSYNENIKLLVKNIIESMGGIRKLIDNNDIVILKVNSQQYNQGATNSDVLVEFIKCILEITNFTGEVIIADNHQDQIDNSRGWTTNNRNGKYNLNELVEYFHDCGFKNVTKYHWHPAGPNPNPLMGDGYGHSIRNHPSEGDGYIWPKDFYYQCPYGHRSVLAYPIFTSAYSGTTVDLKDGAFKNGKYTGQPTKFFNFSALNYHSRYSGVTASVKNMMGVVDMSCGYPGTIPENTYNTHYIGASKIYKLIAYHRHLFEKIPGFWDFYSSPNIFRFHFTGGVLGSFLKKIKKPDYNIITAIKVGWGSRTDLSMASETNKLLASKDPVALDFWAAETVLLDAAKKARAPEAFINLIDPKLQNSRFRMFLEECRREFGGTLSFDKINVIQV